MVKQEKNEEAIFNAAIEFERRDERDAYLAETCSGDKKLRTEVEALLKAHYEGGSLLDVPAFGAGVTLGESPLAEGPGSKIGRYKLLQMIGEGGFACVYMAEQEEPVRRKVAFKIIKLGMDTKQVIARFEAERQALALMEHPNIAKVFDGGATDTGRPYFVMELVKGIPITEYCDKNNLETQQRLELFIDVCKAVQHAHQKGIIHRDIKPTNVMVTLHDGEAVPKVIDFGIAKATQQRLTEKTLFTEYRQLIGTPAYMSPEQAEMSGLDIDTRTDIYSLGVLLYELLTGSTPFEADRLRSTSYDEMCRIIRETEPPKPSTRLSTLGDVLAEVAKHRHVQPGELCKIVRGELDWVVMKTLEKDRTRRYETANELAMDIERHLSHEPVVAGPPGAMYRVKKFVRRHRTGVLFGLMVAAALVAGLAVAMVGFVQASRQRDLTEEQRRRASVNFVMARDAVDEMTDVAEKQLTGDAKARRELLEKAWVFYAGFVENNSDDPAVVEETAKAYKRVGEIHTSLGNIIQAREAFEQAIALQERLIIEFPDVPEYRAELALWWGLHAYTFHFTHKQQENLDSCRKRVAVMEELVSAFPMVPEYRKRLALAYSQFASVLAEANLLKESEIHDRKAVGVLEKLYADFSEIPKDLDAIAECHLWFGVRLLRTNQLPEAEQHLRKALALREQLLAEDPNSASHLGYLAHQKCYIGDLLFQVGKVKEAEKEYREAIAIREKLIEEFPGHFEHRRRLGHALSSLSSVLRDRGQVQEAEDALREAVFHWEKLAGDHPEVNGFRDNLAGCIVELGNLLRDTGQLEEAEQVYSQGETIRWELLELYSRAIETNPNNTEAYLERGNLHLELKQYDKALADYLAVIDLNPDICRAWHGRGQVYLQLEQWDNMAAEYSQAIELRPENAHYWHLRGVSYLELGEPNKAIADYSRAIDLEPNQAHYWHMRGASYRELGEPNKAVAEYSQAIELKPDYWWYLHERGYAYLQLGQWDRAVVDYTRAISLKPDDWSNWNRRGQAYVGLGEHEKAALDLARARELNPTLEQTTQNEEEVVAEEEE